MKKLLFYSVLLVSTILVSCKKGSPEPEKPEPTTKITVYKDVFNQLFDLNTDINTNLAPMLDKFVECGFIESYTIVGDVPIAKGISLSKTVLSKDVDSERAKLKEELEKKLKDAAAKIAAVDWSKIYTEDIFTLAGVQVTYADADDTNSIVATAHFANPKCLFDVEYKSTDPEASLQSFTVSNKYSVYKNLYRYSAAGTIKGVGEVELSVFQHGNGFNVVWDNGKTKSGDCYYFRFTDFEAVASPILYEALIEGKYQQYNIEYNAK